MLCGSPGPPVAEASAFAKAMVDSMDDERFALPWGGSSGGGLGGGYGYAGSVYGQGPDQGAQGFGFLLAGVAHAGVGEDHDEAAAAGAAGLACADEFG